MFTQCSCTEAVTVPEGCKVKLTDMQAKLRMHCLKNINKDVYEVVNPIQFKRYEVINIDFTGMPKALKTHLKALPEPTPISKFSKV